MTGLVQKRGRLIRVSRNITREEIRSLENELLVEDDITRLEAGDHRLLVEYRIPGISLHHIMDRLMHVLGNDCFNPFQKWKYFLLAYLERNECSHLTGRYGWQNYLTDIYVEHFHYEREESDKKKLWQNYDRAKKISVTRTP